MAQLGTILQSFILFQCLLRTIQASNELEIKDLEIGKFQIVFQSSNNTENSTIYLFTPQSNNFRDRPITKNSSVNVGLTIYYIQQFQEQNDKGVFYGITPLLEQSSVVVIFNHSKTALWKTVKVNYILSRREDIFCGNLIFARSLNTVLSRNNSLKLAKGNKIAPKSNYNYITLNLDSELKNVPAGKKKISYFISAMKSNVSNISISISAIESMYGPSNGPKSVDNFRLQLRTSYDTKRVQIFNVTYVMYLQNSIVYFRTLPAYISSFHQFLTKKEDFRLNKIIGISSYNGTRFDEVMLNPLPSYKDQDMDETLLFETFDSIFEIQQIEVIYRQKLKLYIKQQNQTYQTIPEDILLLGDGNFINYSYCLENDGQIVQTRQLIELCAFCGPNQQFNPNCLKCECKQNFKPHQGKCKLQKDICGQITKIYINEQCYTNMNWSSYCKLNFYRQFKGKKCDRCLEKFIEKQVDGEKICVPDCPQGFYFNILNYSCECYPGYFKFNQTYCIQASAVSCGPLYEWNSSTMRCQCEEQSIKGIDGGCLICSKYQKFNKVLRKCQAIESNRKQNQK